MKDLRSLAIATFAILASAAVVAFADIFPRLSVVESEFSSIDKKLDQLLASASSHRR